MMIRKGFVLIAALTLSACALESGFRHGFAPEKIEVTTNSVDKSVTYLAPDTGKESDVVRLRATLNANGRMVYDIYVLSAYQFRWRYYDAALDGSGNSLPFQLLSRDMDSCISSSGRCLLKETVSVSISREYLLARQESGISFELYGMNGREAFTISGAYVKSFLQAVPERASGAK